MPSGHLITLPRSALAKAPRPRAGSWRLAATKAGEPSLLLKRLVWLYFWLLILEGALRKWILPAYSAPLLIVRDPVVLWLYAVAARDGIRPQGRLFHAWLGLAVASVFLVILQWLLLSVPASVLIFGLRTGFLHLPMIFLIPLILDAEDLRRLGRWVLLLTIPMALLMACQFQSSPDAWINRTPGYGEGRQLLAVAGRVRPPGTFSFITGAVSFFALATAFLLQELRMRSAGRRPWLLLLAALATGLAIAVSGSRSLVIGVLLVAAVWLLAIAVARQTQAELWRLALLLVITLAVLVQVQLFREGTQVLTQRWETAALAEEPEGGLFGRLLRSLLSPLQALEAVPLFGSGLGLGTNVGAALITGQARFLLAEEEWGRLVLEMGPVLGLAMIGWRVWLTFFLARACVQCTTTGSLLPLLLFGAAASHLLTGQLSQPTTLGFTVLLGGLCLAAVHAATPSPPPALARLSRFPLRKPFP